MIINYLSLMLSFILPTSLNILAFNALSIISSPLKLLPGNDDNREIEASFLKPNVGSEYPFQKRPPNHLIDTAIRIKLFIKVWRLWKQRRRKRHATGLFSEEGMHGRDDFVQLLEFAELNCLFRFVVRTGQIMRRIFGNIQMVPRSYFSFFLVRVEPNLHSLIRGIHL